MLYWRRCANQIWVVLLIASTHSRPQLNPISVRYWGVRKRPGIAICTKKLPKSDQEMKTTSITQAAIFVYFIGAHVSGIWVLGKWLTNQTKSPLSVVCSYFPRVTYCPIRSIFIVLTETNQSRIRPRVSQNSSLPPSCAKEKSSGVENWVQLCGSTQTCKFFRLNQRISKFNKPFEI